MRRSRTGPNGTLWAMQAVFPHMVAQGWGRIVNVASANGIRGAAGYGPYNASKEAIRGLTRTAAREWATHGIVVNCYCPAAAGHREGPVEGDIRRDAWHAMYSMHPMDRDGDAEDDIAPPVLFLLSTRVKVDGVPVLLAGVDPSLLRAGATISGKARYSTDPGRIVELELVKDRPAAEPDLELIDEQTLRFTTTIAKVTSNAGDVALLTGKHVLVGSTALAAADLRISPLGEMPGVEHHATMLSNLLHSDFFTLSPRWANALLVIGAAVLAAFVAVSVSIGGGLLLTALLLLTLLTGSYVLSANGLYVPIVGPSAAVSLTFFSCLTLAARASRNATTRANHEREFVRQTFGRYLTEQVVQTLLDSPDGLKLGGKRDFVTIMMTDLRGFTSMCGTMEPENVVKLLNHYLEAMTRIITRYGGTIDEFIARVAR